MIRQRGRGKPYHGPLHIGFTLYHIGFMFLYAIVVKKEGFCALPFHGPLGFMIHDTERDGTVFFPIKTICLNRENDIGKIGNFCQFLFKTKMPTLPLILVSFSLLRQRFHAFLSHFQVFFDAIFPNINNGTFQTLLGQIICLNREKNGIIKVTLLLSYHYYYNHHYHNHHYYQ